MDTDDYRDICEAMARMAGHAEKAAGGNDESQQILAGFFRRIINDRRIMTHNGLVDLSQYLDTGRFE